MRKPALLLRRLFNDKRGLSAVTVAVSMPVLFGVAGLGVDTGLWYTIKRQNQSAADAAALSAAYEVIGGHTCPTDVPTYLTPAATEAATRNNYGGTTPFVTCPYSDAIVTNGVQVKLSQIQNAWFSSWFPAFPTFTIANEAVAAINTLPPACMLALNPTANNAVNLAGNPTINAPSCTIVSDSDSTSAFHLQGSATINAATLITPGQISHTGAAYTLNLSYPAQTGANFVPDPYGPAGSQPFTNPCTGKADYLSHSFLTCNMPTAPSCTKTASTWSGSCVVSGASINPGDTLSASTQISGGLSFKGGTVNLSPGTYWITDGDLTLGPGGGGTTLTCPTCTNGGAGVTVILTTAKPGTGTVGTVNLNSLANLNLNAPNTGTYKGLVLIQDSNNPPAGTTIDTNNTLQANATETLSGLVYFPGSAVNFQGTPAATGPQCLVLVANTVGMQGNPGFATSGCSSIGLNNLPIVKTVYLAE
jgi:Flp pilus assembly protein TadG